jgi:hypothetical protein
MSRLHENALIASFHVGQFGIFKTNTEIARQGSSALGVDSQYTRAQIRLYDESINRAIRKVEAAARSYLHKKTSPWSDPPHAERLLLVDDVYEVEQKMADFRMEREDVADKLLFKRWDILREEARIALNDQFREEFFPDVSVVRRRFKWELKITPIYDIRNIRNNVHIKAHEELQERAIQNKEALHKAKTANLVADLMDGVTSLTNGVINGIDSYQYNEEDGKKNNSLPKKPSWDNLIAGAERIEKWAPSFDNDNMTKTATQVRDLVDHIRAIADGDLSKARKVLSGEDDSMRQDVRKRLSDINRTASQVTGAFDEFMS